MKINKLNDQQSTVKFHFQKQMILCIDYGVVAPLFV
ncbi:hypothetical protein AOLE_13620 [Acinetobacter oleivorans DR1]|uniref:Uncharacterized protein n=1 Tax=Acinetobacter oleivorans (strain JCM 16667 / KCTC 23045 / DR1) TaxID=436717 RepID=A0AAN0PA09_ACISD|nr:hypothetical protein AOLE_13620 [Acinetobacter oleivorans DR1]